MKSEYRVARTDRAEDKPRHQSPLEQCLLVAVEQDRGANIGTSLRCAVAFRADAFVLVGSNKYSTHGAHGAQAHIPVFHFYHWDEFLRFAKRLRPAGCEVCGLHGAAADESALRGTGQILHAPETYDFPCGAVALLLPDRRTGRLSAQQLEICDTLLRSRFVACSDDAVTDSVHLDVKASICLQRYATLHSNNKELLMEEEKFAVESQTRTISCSDVIQAYAEWKRQAKSSGDERGECVDTSALFADEDADY
mmetsp:Transcript_8435/g.15892  ORF Transcript_8435/g.15892 Transcript_8435/m.15892 type:complete len:252 (+) Transcript_8435:95-850(+)